MTIGTLSSGAIVDSSGASINADDINLTSKTFSASNTTLSTALGEIVDFHQNITKTDALNLSGSDSKVSLNASALGRTEVVGSLLTSWVDNVTWSGGEYHFTGTYTQSAADSAIQKIQAQYGSNVRVTFDEIVPDPIPADVSNGLSAATANSIIAENSSVSTGGAIFTAFDANAVDARLTVGQGSGTNDVGTSVGFVGINGDNGALVTNGRTLVLLGSGGSDVISTGTVTADNGTLRLGTNNTGVTVGGRVNDVDLAGNGVLASYRGSFTVGNVSGTGSVDHESGTIVYENLDIAGNVTNKGTMTLGDGASWTGGTNTGRLNTESIEISGNFSNSGGTWYLNGGIGFGDAGRIANGTGTIYSKFGNFFDNGTGAEINPLNTVTVGATRPETVRTIKTELFTQYIKGTVKEDVLEHMTFDGNGVLHVTDATLTTTQRDDLTKAFKEAFGDSTQLVFDGTISGTSENSVLNVAKVNQLQNAGFTGVVYFDRELEGENAAVAVGSAGIRDSVGFMGINEAGGTVSITDKKQLVLVGKRGSDGDSYNLTDGESVAVQNGTLTLGSLGLQNSSDYSGTITSVSLGASGTGGTLSAVAGNYRVDTVTASNAASSITVGSAGVLNAGNVTISSGATIDNDGTLGIADTLVSNGGGSITNDSSMTIGDGLQMNGTGGLTNNATLNVSGDTSVAGGGSIVNAGNATLNGNLSISGSLTNRTGAFLETNTMTVNGILENHGRIEASDDSSVYGTLTNTGTIDLFDTIIGNRGTLNNTHSITGQGTITVNGLLSNVENADFTGETLLLTAGETTFADEGVGTYAEGVATVENAGSMDFDSITVGDGTEFWNNGTLVADNLVVEEGGYQITSATATQARAARAGTWNEQLRNFTIAGSKTNAGRGAYGSGKISSTGTFTTAAGGETHFGISDAFVDATGLTIEAGGRLVTGGTTYMGGSLENAGSITGEGTLVLQNAAASANGNTFSNTGTIDVGTLTTEGTIHYVQAAGSLAADRSTLTNSTFVIEGGSFDVASVGTGNTYTFGKAGADSSVNVTASVGTVTSDNVYNILEGSSFDGRDIQLTANEKTVHLLGGTLETTLDQIFGDIDYSAIDIDAGSPDDLVDVEGVKVATSVGDVQTSIEQGIEFGWGTVAFDDAVYSTSVVSDVLQKLDDIDVDTPGHENQLEVAFNGAASENFTVDLANQVKARPAGTSEPFGSAYAVFAGETLTNTTTAGTGNTALYVGRSDTSGLSGTNILDNNIGFKAVEGASGGMTVADGRHFVLVGELQSVRDAADFEMVDGALTIKADGTLTLGTYGTAEETAGKLRDVAVADGTLRVRHGSFSAQKLTAGNGSHIYIGGDGEAHNGSVLRADDDAAFAVASYEAGDNSEAINWGTFTVGTMTTASGAQSGGKVENRGTLDVGTATIATSVDNYGSATFDTLTLNGQTITNENDATLDVDSFTLANGATLTNAGSMTAGTTTVSGAYNNREGATVDYEALSFTSTGVLDNDGIASADTLNMTGGRILNDGTFTLNATGHDRERRHLYGSGRPRNGDFRRKRRLHEHRVVHGQPCRVDCGRYVHAVLSDCGSVHRSWRFRFDGRPGRSERAYGSGFGRADGFDERQRQRRSERRNNSLCRGVRNGRYGDG